MKVFKVFPKPSSWLCTIHRVRLSSKLIFTTLLYLSCSLILFSCAASKQDIITQTVEGTYSGVTSDDKPVTVTVDSAKHGFKGQGTLDGEPFVISGVEIWSATGTLLHADGTSTLVKLYLEPGSENLVIQNLGETESVLSSGGVPVVLPSGPFSGKYRIVGEGSDIASAKITQSGSLLVGTARISDQFTAITGMVTEPNKAAGTITYMDESQVYFEAELSEDGQTVTFSGIGDPIILEKF